MKLSFSERVRERIAALFPAPEALTGEACEAQADTPFGPYLFSRDAEGAAWGVTHDGVPLAQQLTPEAAAEAFHADLAARLQALMETHAAIAGRSGTISGREPGGRRWSLDVTGDGLLRMIALGLREPGL